MKIVNLGEKGEEKQVKIGTIVTGEVQKQLHALLREFKDVFCLVLSRYAWSKSRYSTT